MKARGLEEYERFRESAFRHFLQWFNGETDEDHAAAVYFNINGAEYVLAREWLENSTPCSEAPPSREELLEEIAQSSPAASGFTKSDFGPDNPCDWVECPVCRGEGPDGL
jgi:hypothetical protein